MYLDLQTKTSPSVNRTCCTLRFLSLCIPARSKRGFLASFVGCKCMNPSQRKILWTPVSLSLHSPNLSINPHSADWKCHHFPSASSMKWVYVLEVITGRAKVSHDYCNITDPLFKVNVFVVECVWKQAAPSSECFHCKQQDESSLEDDWKWDAIW